MPKATPSHPTMRKTPVAERNRVAKTVVRDISRVPESARVPAVIQLLRVGRITVDVARTAIAYYDPPRTLEELQQAASTPAVGYDIHHIVEQTPAEQDGFPRSLIDSPENLVRVPEPPRVSRRLQL